MNDEIFFFECVDKCSDEEYEYKNDLGETNIPKTYLWIDKNKPWY